MFYGCSSLISLPEISKWNTNNVTYMGYMFKGCKSLTSFPDISIWEISSLTNKMDMFDECPSASSLPNILDKLIFVKDEHLLNILLISVTLLVFHLDISGNDINDEHR